MCHGHMEEGRLLEVSDQRQSKTQTTKGKAPKSPTLRAKKGGAPYLGRGRGKLFYI